MGFASGIAGYDATKRADEIAKMVDLGVTICRFDCWWSNVEGAGKGASNWGFVDNCVNDLNAAGIIPLLMIGYTPDWAHVGNAGDDKRPPTNDQDFADFCQRVVNRYKGAPYNVKNYELWNEPNIAGFFNPPNIAKYTNMVKLAYPLMKAADPNCVVITGGMSPAPDTAPDIDPRTFLVGIYANGGGGKFDAVGMHPYYGPHPNANVHDWSAWSQMFVPLSDPEMSKASLRETMIANGDTAKKIWATEANMLIQNDDIDGFSATEPRQAAMLPVVLDEWGAFTWSGPFFYYNYQDHNGGVDSLGNEGGFSMKRSNGTLRPAYAAYRDYAAVEDTVVVGRSLVLPSTVRTTVGRSAAAPSEIAVSQKLRPVADVAVGGWGPTPLHDKIDEVVADDFDYIQAILGSVPARIVLNAGATPAVRTGHVLRYRARRVGTGAAVLRVRLYVGATQISEWEDMMPGTFTTMEHTLTQMEAEAITDYGSCSVEIAALVGVLPGAGYGSDGYGSIGYGG
jgi:hypothetical protein